MVVIICQCGCITVILCLYSCGCVASEVCVVCVCDCLLWLSLCALTVGIADGVCAWLCCDGCHCDCESSGVCVVVCV